MYTPPLSRSDSYLEPTHQRSHSAGSSPTDRTQSDAWSVLPSSVSANLTAGTLRRIAQIPLPESPSEEEEIILASAPDTPVPSRMMRAWNKTKSGFAALGASLKRASSATGTYLKDKGSAMKTALVDGKHNHPKLVRFAKRAGIVAAVTALTIGLFAAGGLFGRYVGYDNAAHWIKDKAVITGNWISATAHKVGHWFKHTAGPKLRDAFAHTPKFEGWKNISIYAGSALAVVGATAAGTVYYIRHKRMKADAAEASPRSEADETIFLPNRAVKLTLRERIRNLLPWGNRNETLR